MIFFLQAKTFIAIYFLLKYLQTSCTNDARNYEPYDCASKSNEEQSHFPTIDTSRDFQHCFLAASSNQRSVQTHLAKFTDSCNVSSFRSDGNDKHASEHANDGCYDARTWTYDNDDHHNHNCRSPRYIF